MREKAVTPEGTFRADFTGSIPLQTRLFYGGEALDPSCAFDTVDLHATRPVDFDVIARASKSERLMYWENSGISESDQLSRWTECITTIFQNKDWTEGEKVFFERLGYDVNSFAVNDAHAIYERYFEGQDDLTKVSVFFDDVISAFPVRTPDDLQRLEEQLDTIQWFTGIFGEKSSEIFTNLLQMAFRLQTDPESFINQDVNRLNNLNQREQELLHFLISFIEEEDEEQPLTEAVIADRIVNYETGKATDAEFDYSRDFAALVQYVESKVDENAPLFQSGEPKNFFSNLAYEMIDRIASRANTIDRELAFALHGVHRYSDEDGKHVFIASHVVPASDFENAERIFVDIDPDVHRENSIYLANNLNLVEFFGDKTGNLTGDLIGTIHIHQEHLGAYHRVAPSPHDYAETARHIEEGWPYYIWGVATKWRGNTEVRMFFTRRNRAGEIVHDEMPVLTEFDLQAADQAA